MSGLPRAVKVLLAIVAILIGVIFGMGAGILAALAGMALAPAVAVGGGAFLTSVPVVLGIAKVIMC